MTTAILACPEAEPTITRPDEDMAVSRKLIKSALLRLHAYARSQGFDNTAMTLELAVTAMDVDSEERRRG